MNLSFALLVLVLSADIILGLMVWLQAPRHSINVCFALLTIAFVGWSAAGYFDQTATSIEQLTPFMAGLPFVPGAFIAFFVVLFSLHFPENQASRPSLRRKLIPALAISTLPIIILALFTRLLVADVTVSSTVGNNIVPGPAYIYFPLYFVTWMSIALGLLINKFRHAHSRHSRLQISYVFAGLLLTTVAAFTTNVVIPLATNNPTASRFGFMSTLFLIAFIGYTIVAHRLFNLRMVVARSAAYVLLLTTLVGLYGLGLVITTNVFFDHNLPLAQTSTFIALALIVAFTLPPLRRYFGRLTDKVFYHDRYDTQTVINNVSTVLASEIGMQPMVEKALHQLSHDLRVANGCLVVLEQDKIYYQAWYQQRPSHALVADDLLLLRPGALVRDELPPGPRTDILQSYDAAVSVELHAKEGLVGFLLLGDKLSGEIYTSQDLGVLEILRKELAVAILNAKAYEEISRFNETLQERVHHATQRLRSANRNLKTLDKAKDDFISVASHQLGTPLTAITGFLSMTLDDGVQNLSVQQQEYITFALEAAERLVAMANDLLNVSRINSGRFVIQPQPVDLVRLAEQEVRQLQAAAGRKHLELSYQPPTTPLPLLMLDESKTRQVIMNFIDNALYYTETGSVVVSLGVEGREVVLTVTDTGIGVPPESQPQLFTKFYRAPNAQLIRPDGTGLGLYLAKQVIEEQHGTLIFESSDHGSTFGFRLPLSLKAPAARPSGR